LFGGSAWVDKASWTVAPLAGHRSNVEALVATAYGVASGSGDRSRPPVGPGARPTAVMRGREHGVGALAVTPTGTEIVSVSRDGTWRRWDAETGRAGPTGGAGEPYDSALVLSLDGELVVTANSEHAIDVWERESGCAVAVLRGYSGYVVALLVTPGGCLRVSGSWDRSLRVGDLADASPLWTLPCNDWLVDLVVTSDGPQVAAYCANGSVFLVDAVAQVVRGVLDLGGRSYGRLALGADDRSLFVLGSCDLQTWDIAAGIRLAALDVDLPLRELVAVGPDTVVVGTKVGTLVPMRLERA
jgi:WD40 repeat protein